MATGTSVVGAWNLFTDWDCVGKIETDPSATPLMFNENGSVSGGGFGNWIQVEGMVAWSLYFTSNMGLFYTANVTRDALIGVMGYVGAMRRGQGCFYATRASSDTTSSAASLGATPTEQDTTSIFGPEQKD